EPELSLKGHELTQAGVDRIHGLRELLGDLVQTIPDDVVIELAGMNEAQALAKLETLIGFTGGNILLGGDGHDVMEGRGGDDFIHGDAWLNVRISIRALDETGAVTGTEAFTVDSLKQ